MKKLALLLALPLLASCSCSGETPSSSSSSSSTSIPSSTTTVPEVNLDKQKVLEVVDAKNYTMNSKAFNMDEEDNPVNVMDITIECADTKVHQYGTQAGYAIDTYFERVDDKTYMYTKQNTSWIKTEAPSYAMVRSIGETAIGSVSVKSILLSVLESTEKADGKYTKNNLSFTVNTADLLELTPYKDYTPTSETTQITYSKVELTFVNNKFYSFSIDSFGMDFSHDDEHHTVEVTVTDKKSRGIYEDFRNIGTTVVNLPDIG